MSADLVPARTIPEFRAQRAHGTTFISFEGSAASICGFYETALLGVWIDCTAWLGYYITFVFSHVSHCAPEYLV